MKRVLCFVGFATLAAALIVGNWKAMPVEERLVRIRAAEALPDYPSVAAEPVEVQAVLADYADDPLLLLQARAALIRHPHMARRVLAWYGPEPEFRAVLREYGPAAILPVQYFIDNEVGSVAALNYLFGRYAELKAAAASWWSGLEQEPAEPAGRLTGEQRGWYAVNFIAAEGHDFLGQFLLGEQGEVRWLRTERMLEGTTAFFTSGIRGLEVRALQGESLRAQDLGWAAVDALVVMSAVKVLRLGKAAARARAAGRTGRIAGYGTRLAGVGRHGLQGMRYAKWPALIGAGYLMLNHPAVINDVLAGLARAAGLPPWLVQLAGWTLLLLPLCYLIAALSCLLAGPLIRVLGLGIRLLRRLQGGRRTASSAPGAGFSDFG